LQTEGKSCEGLFTKPGQDVGAALARGNRLSGENFLHGK
jgi:hypothetical protein